MRRLTKLTLIAGLAVLGLMTAAAAAQTITWVSVSATGSGGAGPSAVSDDGRLVAFRSGANDLVPGDTNDSNDIFVKDMQTGAIERVSVSSSDAQADSSSGFNTVDISDDGRLVLFDSNATNLVSGDTNDKSDLFIRDRQTGETTRVMRDDGTQGTGVTSIGAISGNGGYVALVGAGFDDVSSGGIFVYDLQSLGLERVTDGVAFLDATGHGVDISDDGRWVAFITDEFNGNRDVVRFDRDTDTWVIANPRLGGAAPQTRLSDVELSGDGQFIAFGSPDTNYVPGDTNDTNDVFVYDSGTDTLELIPGGGASSSQYARPVISDSGRYVAFTSGLLDIYGDANGQADVVVFDRQTDAGEVVSVHNDGSPADRGSGSHLFESSISGDGRFVVFLTNEGFDPDDPGNSTDFYIVDREGTTTPPPTGECTHDFTDVDSSNIFESDICWLADQGITRGCNPPANTEFCPTDPVTRGQMAAFLHRALGDVLTPGPVTDFVDDDDSVFEADIEWLGATGVTRGCNPPTNNRFCPGDNVTRGQMAAFLVRALDYTDDGGGDLFVDDDDSVFEADIDRLGTAAVTRGCNPPLNDRFCPGDNVTRQQMAAFLRRALEG
ncbi:MAG: S-layer homology domain-containing protein [Acidimicrobiia bacterium]